MSENGSPYIKAKNHISNPRNVELYLKYREKSLKRTKKMYVEHHEEHLLRAKKNREEYRAKLNNLLGIKCFICGKEGQLIFHEIYGTPHTANRVYIILHYKDFVRLCADCHKSVHHLRKEHRLINLEKLASLIS